MNVPLDTLAFAEQFEGAGFGHDQVRVLATAFAQAQEGGRADLVTNSYLDLRLSEFEGRFNKQVGELEVRLTRQIGEVGKDLSSRLWSTVAVIAGVSTTISATIGAAVALVLKWGGI